MNRLLAQNAMFTEGWSSSNRVIATVFVVHCAILAIFFGEVVSALSIWSNDAAYSHCYLILPISLYLIYSQHAVLSRIEPAPSLFGAVLFLGCIFVWWLGMAASIAEIRQLAVVGMLQAATLCLLGWRFYRCILFPMLYLFLMVPTGTVLLEPLQTVTTVLSSFLLRLSGIPVFGENHLIEVPHGLYEVAPGCAGLNFLLSTLALSLVYVFLLFRGWGKRLTIVAAALLLSILTNAVRVFGIIWLAEATERRIDIVDDHLLYGWGVYGVVMLAAMVIGYRFRDPMNPHPVPAGNRVTFHRYAPKLSFAAFTLIVLAGGAQTSFAAVKPAEVGDADVRIDLPANVGEWLKADRDVVFGSSLASRADGVAKRSYVKSDGKIDVSVTYYWHQREGHKIGDAAANPAATGTPSIEIQTREIVMAGAMPMTVRSTLSIRGKTRVLVWSYYWVGGFRTANTLLARILGIKSTLGKDGRSAAVVLTALDNDGKARSMFVDFFENIETVDRALADASLHANR